MSRSGADVCAVCREEPTDARILPCGNRHVFCLQPCLRQLLDHHRQQPDTDRNRFPCPLCRTMVTIPPKGPEAFEPILHDRAPPGTRMVFTTISVEEQRRLFQEIHNRARQDGRAQDRGVPPQQGEQTRGRLTDRGRPSPVLQHQGTTQHAQARQPATNGLRIPQHQQEEERQIQAQRSPNPQRPRNQPRVQFLQGIEDERRSLEHGQIAEDFQREEERRSLEELRIQEQIESEDDRRTVEGLRLNILSENEDRRIQLEDRRLVELQAEEDRRAAAELQLLEDQQNSREQAQVLSLAEQGLRRVKDLMHVFEGLNTEQRERARRQRDREGQRRGNSSGVCSVM